jgi:hypothetical protein
MADRLYECRVMRVCPLYGCVLVHWKPMRETREAAEAAAAESKGFISPAGGNDDASGLVTVNWAPSWIHWKDVDDPKAFLAWWRDYLKVPGNRIWLDGMRTIFTIETDSGAIQGHTCAPIGFDNIDPLPGLIKKRRAPRSKSPAAVVAKSFAIRPRVAAFAAQQ